MMRFHLEVIDGETWLMYGPYKVARMVTNLKELEAYLKGLAGLLRREG